MVFLIIFTQTIIIEKQQVFILEKFFKNSINQLPSKTSRYLDFVIIVFFKEEEKMIFIEKFLSFFTI